MGAKRKYYPLSERDEAKQDLIKAFAPARMIWQSLQTEEVLYMQTQTRCVQICIFKLEEQLKEAGIMKEEEWFNDAWIAQFADAAFKKQVAMALFFPEPPWIADTIAENERELADILRRKTYKLSERELAQEYVFGLFGDFMFLSTLQGNNAEELKAMGQKIRELGRVLIEPLMLEQRLKEAGRMLDGEALNDAWYDRQPLGKQMRALVNALTYEDQGTPNTQTFQTTLF